MKFLNKDWKIELLLVITSFGIYFFYLHHIFFGINSLLSSITGDAIKNYYTFVYHIKNNDRLLHFSGMNFPYGEHVIYTDCQPLLTFVLRCLPFAHEYLIGIMHSLIFLSFIFTPLILFRVLKKLGLDQFASFFISIAIGLLSPQFEKINSGHHGLAYGCVIPLSVLLFLNVVTAFKRSNVIALFSYNTLLFLIHPYLGLGSCIFSLVSFLVYAFQKFNTTDIKKYLLQATLHGILPVLLFKIFMKFTDEHKDRIAEPYGNKELVENLDTLMAPDFGPFAELMNGLFPNKVIHYEGHSYLGFFTIVLSVVSVFVMLILFKKASVKREISSLFIAAIVLLLISFGLHMQLLDMLGIKATALSQFRANSRFAWYFYFLLPLFVCTALYYSLKVGLRSDAWKLVFRSIAVIYFLFNGIEAHAFLQKNKDVFWKYSNVFRSDLLNEEEQANLNKIRNKKPQAIVPLPIFHTGSELFTRVGFDNSMIPSMIYSYHAAIPIISGWMSRTSISETAEAFELLNTYDKTREALKYMNGNDLLVIKTRDALLPIEERFEKKVAYFSKNDTLEIGFVAKAAIDELNLAGKVVTLKGALVPDSLNIVYVAKENRKPFTVANMRDYETIYALDSNKIKPGKYVVSFHYHYSENSYKAVGNNLIVSHRNPKEFKWQNYLGVNTFSGYYPGFGVFEYNVELENGNQYDFVLIGYRYQAYRISNFLLRPKNTDVVVLDTRGDTAMINNYPR